MNTQTVQDLLRKQDERGVLEDQDRTLRRLAQEVRDIRVDLRLDGDYRESFIVFANRIEELMGMRQAKIRNLTMDIGQTVYDAGQDGKESANEPPLVY